VQHKQFTNGQPVLVRVYASQQCKWTHGTILRSTGPVSYIIKLPNGLTWRHYQDQLKLCSELKPTTQLNESIETVPQDMLSVPSISVSSDLTDSTFSDSSKTQT